MTANLYLAHYLEYITSYSEFICYTGYFLSKSTKQHNETFKAMAQDANPKRQYLIHLGMTFDSLSVSRKIIFTLNTFK